MVRNHDIQSEVIIVGGADASIIVLCDDPKIGFIALNGERGNSTVRLRIGDFVDYSIMGVKWSGRFTGDVTPGGSAIFERSVHD